MSGLIDTIGEQEWLGGIEEPVQTAVTKAFEAGGDAGKKVQNALNGTWLGHPLHPVVTDIPIGAWSTAAALDLLGIEDGADAAIALGLLGAVAAAASGITDWKDIHGEDRRPGFVHGVLNTAVAALYAGSLIARRQGKRTTGKTLAFVGLGILGLSSWIGGELVYRFRDGVDHSLEVEPPSDWTPVMADADLPENELRGAGEGGSRAVLVKRGGRIFALGGICSHWGGKLAEGTLEGDCVTCPWHGSRFRLEDGSVVQGPATLPQPCFETRVRDGQIEIKSA